jgi:16S rRNA (cytosine967-C5)-methyltransferase
MRASSAQPFPAVRVNAAREDAASLRARLLTEGKGLAVGAFGVVFPEGLPYFGRELERKGGLSFQSAGVLEAMEALDVASWQGPVWDACAGRGGKTAAMLERGVAVAAATDISPGRITGLSREFARLGLPALPEVYEADAASPPRLPVFQEQFATVLADVPCSGLGTLSRRPEIRFRRTAADIAALTAAQDAILAAAAAVARPGGRIVYLTCTLNPAENEDRVRAFLAAHREFSLCREWKTPPTSPWREFFYGAVLRRETPTATTE